jgi:hypothetical protein
MADIVQIALQCTAIVALISSSVVIITVAAFMVKIVYDLITGE